MSTACQGELPEGGDPARPAAGWGRSPGGGGARRGRARPPARPPALPFLPSLPFPSPPSLPFPAFPFPSLPARASAVGGRPGPLPAGAWGGGGEPWGAPAAMSPLFGWVAKVSPGAWRGSERAKEESWKTGLKTGVKNGVKSEAPAALRGCRGGKVRVKARPGVLREHLTPRCLGPTLS